MALLRVLAFDHEGRPIQFDMWLDDLQLYLLSDSKDSVSLFDLVSGAAIAPPATADTQALYDAVVARYSSPATAALGRLLLPYLFPELSAFTTVEDLVSHLRTSDARYRAAIPAEFLDRNPPQMYITLYFIVTRLPDSLRSVRDHFLSLDPTSLTVDLLEQHLHAAETSAVAVGAARGTPRPPFFEGCSPSPLAPSYASAAAVEVSVPEDVGTASASAKRRSGKGKGVRGGGGGSGSGGGGSIGGGGGCGIVGGSGGSCGGGGGSGGSGGSGGGGTGSGGTGARRVDSGGGQCQQQLLRSRSGIAIFDLDFDAILSARYALSVSAESDCYQCVPPDPGIAAAALGASESSTLRGTAPAEALHTFTGGEFSSNLLREFCRGEGILQSFTLPDSPQQNGIAERRIGLVMEVAHTSMIHAAAPHFLWPFAVRYAAHQLNLWPRVSLQETSPTLHWTGEVGDASVFRVWQSRAFVRDTSADKLSPRAIPCIFLGFVPDAPGWQFYHPTLCRVLPSQDVTFDESVPFTASSPTALPLPRPLRSSLLPPGGAESKGAETGGAGPGGVATDGGEPGGAEPEDVEPGSVASEGAESGGSAGASPSLSPQQLREWFVWRTHLRRGASGAGGSYPAGAGGPGVAAGAGVIGGTVTTGLGGARTRGTGDAGTGGVEGTGARDLTESGTTGAGGAGAGGVGVGGPGAGGAGVGGLGVGGAGAGAVDPGGASQPPLQPASPLPAPSPYTEQSGGLTERREPASHPLSPVRIARRVPRSRPPPVPGTHAMTLRPSSFPLRVPLPTPPAYSLPESAAASALVAELLDFAAAYRLDYATALVAKSTSASPLSIKGECALGTDVLEDRQEDFECLAAAVPRFASMLLAPEGDPDAPDIPTPRSYAEAITRCYSSQWQAAMDAEMASWKFTGTYVDEVSPPGANIVDGMWIFRVKRPPSSPPAFKARYVARGFSHRQGVDYFQNFSPTPKMTTLWVLLHVAAQRNYELHSLDFSTTFLQGSLHEEIWLRRPPGFTESFPAGTQWSLRRLVYGLRQAPHEWHDTMRTTLSALGFAPATADPSLFLRTDTSLRPFYVLVYVDNLVFVTADTKALTLVKSELQKRHTCTDLGELRSYLGFKGTTLAALRFAPATADPSLFLKPRPRCRLSTSLSTSFSASASSSPRHSPLLCLPATHSQLHLWTSPTSGMGLMLGGRGPVVLTGHVDASWVDNSATQRSSLGYTFSLCSGSVSWRSTRSSSVLSSSCEAEIYAGAMVAQELRWLTYLLTDLGEQPRSPPILYRRGQLRLEYVATRANTADVFTKALPPSDHQHFVTVLGLLALLFLTGLVTTCSPPLCLWGRPSLLAGHCCTRPSSTALPVSRAVRLCHSRNLVSHLRTSDARYRAALPAEFLAKNTPPMYITLYFIVTRLPDSLRAVRDHFLTLDPTALTIDLLDQHLLAAETSVVADVGATSASGKSRSNKGKGGRGGRGGSGGGGGGSGGGGGGSRGRGSGGSGGGSGGFGCSGGGRGGSGCSGSGGSGGGRTGAQRGDSGGGQRQRQQRGSETPSPQQLRGWLFQRGASGSNTTLTPLPTPVPVRLADPSKGPVVARSSTVLPCPAVPSGSLSGLHLPSFSTNLVSTAALQDAMVTTTTPRGQRVLSLPPSPGHVHSSARVEFEHASYRVSSGRCLCSGVRVKSGSTPLLVSPPVAPDSSTAPPPGSPLPTTPCGMHYRLLVSGLPRSLPPLTPSPAPPCLSCVEGRQRAAPHSSSFPPTTCSPADSPHGRGQVIDVLIPWIRAVRLQLRERFCADLSVLRLHFDRGGEFSSDLLRDFCRGEGILQSFMLPDSPEQYGIAERRIGLVMEVARTSMIHAAAPHFLWSFAVRYAAHQLNLWPRVSLPETSPTLRWTGKVGDASVFRGPAPLGVSHVDPLPGTVPVEVAGDSGAARGTTSGGAEPGGAKSEGAGSGGAEPGGAEPGGAEFVGVEPGGVEPEGVEPGGAESEGAESRGAEPRGATLSGGRAGASPSLSPRPETLSPQQLCEWLVRRARLCSGSTGAGGTGNAGAGGARTRGTGTAGTGGVGGAGAGDPTEPGAAGAGGVGEGGTGAGGASAGGVGAVGTRAGGTGTGGARAGGAGAVEPGARGAGGTVRLRLYFVPLLQQTGSLTERCEPASRPASPVCTGPRVPHPRPPPVPGTHAMGLGPSSVPLRIPLLSPPESSLLAVPDPESYCTRAAIPTISRLLATIVTDPSFESTAASALVAELLDFAAACRLYYAIALVAESASASPPSVGGECALSTDVLEDGQEDFECLVATVPRFASMLLAPEGDPNAPDIPTPRSYAEAITGPYSSKWQAAMDAEMASWKSSGTYRDHELHSLNFSTTFLQCSLHEEIWLRRPPGFTGTTLAALGFTPSTADPLLFLCSDTLLPPFSVLVFVDDLVFATADTEALTLVKWELQKRHTCTDLGELRNYLGLQITRDKARHTITLTQSHMVHQVLQRFGFHFSLPHPTPLFTGQSLSAPPSNESVEPSGPYLELVGCLMYLMTCTQSDLAYPLSLLARYVAPGSTSGMGLVLGGRGPVVLTGHADASSVDDSATSNCEAEIYAGAMAAQELRWLTYLLTDLGEQPRLPPQRGQLRLAYVATRANTADIFTKALPPGDHQRFSIVLGLVPTLPHLLTP
ncbi:unnamed protein product [Closterium sp. NIES-53]